MMRHRHRLALRHDVFGAGRCSFACITAALVLLGTSEATCAEAMLAAQCAMRIRVELSPDVPNPRDSGFLSSLLGDHPSYRLILRREVDDTHLDLELSGPGPAYRCRNVIDSMRKDGRVLSIHVH